MTSAAPLLGASQRGPLRTAIDLWRANGAFRGFAEFALVGGIILMFLLPTGSLGIGDAVRSALHLVQSSQPQADAPAQGSLPKFGTALPLAPRPSDVAFDAAYFAGAPEAQRSRLQASLAAYRARQYRRALDELDSADQSDRLVLLMRATCLIALTDPGTFDSGIGLLQKAIDLGEPRAMALLGVLEIMGVPGLPRDPQSGRRLLERAAAEGDAKAPRIIGEGFISGWMGTVDPARAVRFLRMASERGDHQATFRLAEMHFQGLGMPKDEREAERLLLAASQAGHAEAQALLGAWRLIPYLSGVTDDPDAALQWLEQASRQGEPHAMQALGMFYVDYGRRTGRLDPPRGVDLFRRCVEATLFGECAFSYATALDFGVGAVRDPVHAFAMYVVANAQGMTPKAKARIDELAKSLSSVDTARAYALANQTISRREGMR